MNQRWQRAGFLLVVLALLGLAEWAAAQQLIRDEIRRRDYTQGEWALLPDWCVDSQDGPYGSPEGGSGMNRSPRAPRWVGLMGHDFWAMHHYCRGLRDTFRLRRADLTPRERLFLIDRAIDEFNYIFNHTKPSMPLQPEVWLKQGEMFLLKNDLASANVAFENARKLLPSYWPAYTRWADVLIGVKKTEAARELLLEGLKHAPDQPEITAMLERVGGTPKRAAGATAPRTEANRTQAPASTPR